jgi:hypothetical protein
VAVLSLRDLSLSTPSPLPAFEVKLQISFSMATSTNALKNKSLVLAALDIELDVESASTSEDEAENATHVPSSSLNLKRRLPPDISNGLSRKKRSVGLEIQNPFASAMHAYGDYRAFKFFLVFSCSLLSSSYASATQNHSFGRSNPRV